MKNKKWWGIAAVVLLLAIPVLQKLFRAQPVIEVETEVVAPHEIKSSVLASGNLVYQEQALLSPEVIGKVTDIYVAEGDKVQRGQVVLHLDDQTYRAEVAQQEAAVMQQKTNIEHQQVSLESQQNQLKRKEELHDKKMIADQQVDDARYAVELAKVDLRTSREGLSQAEAVLRQNRERLEKTNIRAPMTGTVTALDIKVGETAVASQIGIAGSSLMTIANTSTIMAEVNVDEADIAGIKLGQEVSIHTAAYPDTALTGSVQSIPLSVKRNDASTSGISQARSYTIKVKLESTRNLTLRPGMTCRAEIYTATANQSLAVPVQAIMSNNDEKTVVPDAGARSSPSSGEAKPLVKEESYVFVNKDGVADKRIVKTGISDDTRQEVVSGIKAGDAVIVGPYKVLRHMASGDKVKAEAKTEAKSQ